MTMYSPKARETAIKEIRKLYVKLADLKPVDNFDNTDIRATMMYLRHFEEEIQSEIREQTKKHQ